MPAAYEDGVFLDCEGDLQDIVGTYTGTDGRTTTWSQPESLPATSTLPWTPRIPASSNCKTYQSTDLFAAAVSYVPLHLPFCKHPLTIAPITCRLPPRVHRPLGLRVRPPLRLGVQPRLRAPVHRLRVLAPLLRRRARARPSRARRAPSRPSLAPSPVACWSAPLPVSWQSLPNGRCCRVVSSRCNEPRVSTALHISLTTPPVVDTVRPSRMTV